MTVETTNTSERTSDLGLIGKINLGNADHESWKSVPAGPVVPRITKATVRVMRSYDYSHFEVTLSADEAPAAGGIADAPLTLERVDALRKEAARLADKAVRQFSQAKEAARKIGEGRDLLWYSDGESRGLAEEAKKIEAIPEGERTPQQKGILKAFKDAEYWANRDPYDYEDDYFDGHGQ